MKTKKASLSGMISAIVLMLMLSIGALVVATNEFEEEFDSTPFWVVCDLPIFEFPSNSPFCNGEYFTEIEIAMEEFRRKTEFDRMQHMLADERYVRIQIYGDDPRFGDLMWWETGVVAEAESE